MPDTKTGRVLPAYIKVYQNNMLLHLAQKQVCSTPAKTSPLTRPRAPTRPSSPPSLPFGATQAFLVEIADLQSELVALWAEFKEFKDSYESSSSAASEAHSNHSPHIAPSRGFERMMYVGIGS